MVLHGQRDHSCCGPGDITDQDQGEIRLHHVVTQCMLPGCVATVRSMTTMQVRGHVD